MAFLIVFVPAFVIALVLRLKGKRQWMSNTAPTVCFVVFVLFDAYVLPYRGGGASMWLIAIMFGAPVAAGVGLLGVIVARRFSKSGQGGDNAV